VEDKHGADVRLLDLRGRSPLADFVLLVTGNSPPHLKALGDELQVRLKREGRLCYRRSGTAACGWLVLDYVDLIIHIFSATARQYYDLEALWAQAPTAE